MTGRVARSNPVIALGLGRAKEKILQYYPLHDTDIEPIKNLYLATIVDPHMKLDTLKKIGITTLALYAAEDYFREVYHRYKKELDEEGGPKRQRKEKKAKSKKSEKASLSFFYDVSQLSDYDDHDGESELRLYFLQRNAKVIEKIEEYYRRNEALFPTIFRMGERLFVHDPRNRYSLE